MLKSQHVAVFPEPSHGADNWPVIDHLPSPSPPAPLLFFPPLRDAKAYARVCVLVCVCVLLATMPVIQGVLVGGFKRRGGRAGLPVFVPAATNAARKPGNEVRLRLCKDLSLLSTLHPPQFPSSVPPSLSARSAHSHPWLPIPHSAQGCCCLLA